MKFELISPAKENSQIIIGAGVIRQLKEFTQTKDKVFLIADAKIYNQYKHIFEQELTQGFELINFDAGDKNKNFETYEVLLKKLVDLGCDRHSLIISFGGGVTSDISGFVASSYMRGIDWIAVPTTLMAQADAAIGGKTGINLGGYKNIVGSFWPPTVTLIDPEFLASLDERELKNGLAEIIKMGLIHDTSILDLLNLVTADNLLCNELYKAAALAAKSKIEIVNQDMHESGGRKIVNFGHTLGHAIESISLNRDDYLLHGEAISIGMIGETKLAVLEGKCEEAQLEKTRSLFAKFGLPTTFNGANLEQILQKISLDKKNSGNKILWTLPDGQGQGTIDNIATQENMKEAISYVITE